MSIRTFRKYIEMGTTMSSQNDDNASVQTVPRGVDPLANPDTPEREVRRRPKSLPDYEPLSKSASNDSGDDMEVVVDPHADALGGDLTSAVLGIIKAMVGPAILYLPHSFAVSGYAVALPILLIATSMYLYCSRCLLEAWKLESLKVQDEEDAMISSSSGAELPRTKKRMLTYPELANRAFGPYGEMAVKLGIALMQSGVCLTYLIFVPHNLHTSIHYLTNFNASPKIWLGVMVLIEIPLSWVTDIRKLTCTNFTANILILYGLMLCLGFAVDEAVSSKDMSWYESATDRLLHLEAFQSQWFLFIGTSVLLFEGSITLLIPLQESVVGEQERQAFPGIYRTAIISIICFYIFFGITCWASFGSNVHVVLTTSLPSGLFATSVQLAYSLAVLMTYPLQNFPALEIATKSIAFGLVEHAGFKQNSFLTKRYVISSLMVLALALVAVTCMNSLDKVVSLMGALLGCPIAFLVPPMIHSKLCAEGLSTARLSLNNTVAICGLVSMMLASPATILSWS